MAHRLSSCGVQALEQLRLSSFSVGLWLLLSMSDLSSLTRDQTRIPVLQDGFLTTEPLGKSPFQPYFILRHLSPPLILYILLFYMVYRPHSRI